jgi:hypothetical protein
MRNQRFFYGWIILAMVPIHLMLIYGIRHSFAVFYSSIIDEFSWSRADLPPPLIPTNPYKFYKIKKIGVVAALFR